MKLSNNGLQQIVKREGVILHAYHDSVGVLTIGTGHTSAAGEPKVVPGMVITKEENDVILRRDLEPIERQVNSNVKVPITQNQYDALVSIIFNVGPGFLRSTAMKRLNAGDYKGAAEAIMMWNKPPEIIGRRDTERRQFLTSDAHADARTSTAIVVAGGTALAATHSLLWLVPVALAALGLLTYEIIQYRKKKTNV